MEDSLEFAANLAQQAGRLLLDYFDYGGSRASRKADRTVVTEADLAADRLIAKALHESYPHDALLSEELHTSLEGGSAPIPTWVVDPLDGTTNFTLGMHFWGVSIARVVDGEPALGALYFPVLDELYTAARGRGAARNGEAIHVRGLDKDQPAAFFSCCSRSHRRYHISVPFKTRILGSAAYDMCSVARGAALLGFQATPHIWDIAAGWLLIQEAGGVVEVLHGPSPFPLRPAMDHERQPYPTLMAANLELAALGRQHIQPKEPD